MQKDINPKLSGLNKVKKRFTYPAAAGPTWKLLPFTE